MDLETENRIAAILLKEAAELRQQAEKEGVQAYIQQPKVRGRPNSRFLSATVLGVQQANRAVEVNEMWRVRQKELELNDRLKDRSKDERSNRSHRNIGNSRSSTKGHAMDDDSTTDSCSSSKRLSENNSYYREDEGLRDEEVEEFLHSRIKRGRGTVGSRMDETGPYLAPSPDSNEKFSTGNDVWRHRVLGPEKPISLKTCESSDKEFDKDRRKKKKTERSGSSNKKHSKKHKSKEKDGHKKKKRREEKKSKHHK
ncbi:DNA topoisomerase 1-like [Pistacia vera]|uniref:DNA topoisomerase 1-like n=1 Tax=Pistacia vera TaxID=55513 RepID=UPI001263D0F0|nr:DNA topoisomerase 1-like [Pistacia vera]